MTLKSLLLGLSLLSLLGLSSCGGVDTDPTYSDKEHDTLYKNGSLVSHEGGLSILEGEDTSKKEEQNGIGVNGFLWRASLDTIAFMPILSADPFGGVILTDWYSSPETPDQRSKINIFIRDRDLRSDGVKVTVFRQTKTASGNWIDASVAPSTATEIENAILTKARQIRLAQKQFQ